MEQTEKKWHLPKHRLVLSVLTAATLTAGATWQGLAADNAGSAPTAAAAQVTTAPPAVVGRNPAGRDSYADIVKLVAPAVVTVRTEGRARVRPTAAPDDQRQQDPEEFFRRFFGDEDPFGGRFGRRGPTVPQMPRRGLGSGVIVTPDGYILTNHHVIDGASDIHIELSDGRTLDAKTIGSDGASDLALLKIEATGLTALALGDSEKVEIGDVVLAVGNPLGLGQTVTMGIVSAKGRHTSGGGSYEDFLQTDAPINQGNSGGALVNLKGELVGINAQIASMTGGNIGIGFAIPANMARDVMDDLKTTGRVRRAQLGVGVQNIDSDMAASLQLKNVSGAIVNSVVRGGAADKAGVRQGDVIVSFDGRPVRDVNSLRNRVAASEPGSKNALGIVRNGNEQTVSITLDELAASRSAAVSAGKSATDAAALGITVAPITPELARRENLPSGTTGLMIESVSPDSRAASAGLREGDVIKQVDRQPVESVDALRSAVQKVKDRPVLLLIHRGGDDMFVTVRQ